MVKIALRLYRFLGSAAFAIILISTTAAFVIAGTLIESHTGSHLAAAAAVYDTPYFAALLWGFFFNILISALRRWPFKTKHIPFLITHLGLLMILGGALVKHYTGIQGAMFLMEGSSTAQVMLPETFALRIDTKGDGSIRYAPIPFQEEIQIGSLNTSVEMIHDHCNARLDTFIKGDWVVAGGIPPIPLGYEAQVNSGGKQRFVKGIKGKALADGLKEFYAGKATLLFSPRQGNGPVIEVALKSALERPFAVGQVAVTAALNVEGGSPELALTMDHTAVRIPLDGNRALDNIPDDPAMGAAPLLVDIAMPPSLLFVEDENQQTALASIEEHGDVCIKQFSQDKLGALYMYDGGYGGYSMQTTVSNLAAGRQQLEHERQQQLRQELAAATSAGKELAPPLHFLQTACRAAGVDFPTACIEFLSAWSQEGQWLYPEDGPLPPSLEQALAGAKWLALPEAEWKGCGWASLLFREFEGWNLDGRALALALEARGWPLPAEDMTNSHLQSGVWETLTRQVFAAAEELPPLARTPPQPNAAARLLSAYFRAYGIHLSAFQGPWMDAPREEVSLECPLTTHHRVALPGSKKEENTPLLVLNLNDQNGSKKMALGYDRTARGLKWPAGGDHLLRFQPHVVDIPHEIWLRRARQITYPNAEQASSYEADIIAIDTHTGERTEATISMNNVFETWDGYRFYLAAMSPPDESATKEVQLAVNRDPAKYLLTYPGALIMSLGIILLFWLRPYR